MLQIYNTLTRQKEIFKPINPGKISMYVCGITVYDYCHIGHARVLVAFDVITKFLRSQGWDVTYVRNITDIDDKIIKRANENGEVFDALTKRFIDYMHEDETRLGIARPDIEPRATAYIEQIVDMNQALIDKGYAYAASNGDVYYRVTRFADYGKLTNKNVDELLSGARVEVDEIKEDPRDFVLWKGAKTGEPAWKSPWGNGRPGWHIECSAMSKHCCGETFDIHGGGPDLPFPHHENEIAQSEAANGCKYVNYWMHAGAVRVDGEKMSKSLGNFFTIRDVLEKYHPEVVRFLLVSSHYRSSINYAEDNLIEARAGLERFYSSLMDYWDEPAKEIEELSDSPYYKAFVDAMSDDFNTRVAIASMFDLVRDINNSKKKPEQARQLVGELKALGKILGILQEVPRRFFGCDLVWADEIEEKIKERNLAKAEKNYARADEVRQWLTDNGVSIKDTPAGTEWTMQTIPDVPWPIRESYMGVSYAIFYSYSLGEGVIRRYIEVGEGGQRVNEKKIIGNNFKVESDEARDIAKALIIANSNS